MDTESKTTLVREFASSMGVLLWPVLIIVVFFIITRVLPVVRQRWKKGDLLGEEIEIGQEVESLKESILNAREVLGLSEGDETSASSVFQGDKEAQDILDVAAADPELAIIKLSKTLEMSTRKYVAAHPRRQGKTMISASGALKSLVEKEYLPRDIANALELCSSLSETIVRRKVAQNHPDIRRVLELGLVLLCTIKSMPGHVR